MKKKSIALIVITILMLGVLTGCSGGGKSQENADGDEGNADAGGDSNYSVVLITIDSMDQHWVTMDKGCKEAADSLGVDYQWMAPDVKDDAKQIETINNAVAGGADAILIAANGPDAVTEALREADEAGVKIVQVDSFANYDSVQQIGTDNESAGEQAGEEVLRVLTEKGIKEGKIGVVSVNAATTSTVDRDNGFRSAFEGTDFEILETQYAEGDAAKSKDAAANFISQGCVALFGANEGSCVGVGTAVEEDGNKIVAAGMDKSDAVIQLIEGGSLICTMAQNPDVMGEKGIEAAVKALNGEEVTPAYIDTGVTMITKDNVAEIK